MKDKPSYLRAAFNARPLGMPIPPNWFGVAAFGLLGALVNPGLWLIGLGVEGLYLWSLSRNERFRATVDAAAGFTDSNTQYDSMLANLDSAAQSHQYAIEREAAEIVGLLQRSEAHTSQIGDVRQMAWLHLKLLAARASFAAVAAAADRERKSLEEQEQRCRARLAEGDTDDELRRSLEQQLEVLQARQEAHREARRRRELVDAELARLRQQVSLVREQALLSTDENNMAQSLDALSASLNEANRWLRDQRELFASLVDDEPPPADLLAAKRTKTRRENFRVIALTKGEAHMVSCRQRGSAAGNIITLLLLVGIVGLGLWLWLGKKEEASPAPDAATPAQADSGATRPDGDAPQPIEPVTGTPTLEAANAFVPKDKVLRIDISEYAGYGGLIVANGGLDVNPDSFFAKEYGFQVQISMSESETWSPLNNGRLAATATTTDALAVLGRQFDAIVPVQIGYSRGADMVVVDQKITSINALKGKTLAASQFNESEFFIRYLAQEAGVPVTVLRDLDSKPPAGSLGLVFYEDAFIACDAYEHELKAGKRLNGCVGWTPKTDEVIEASNGAAKMLVSNRNLLVVADVLAVNKGFAKANPEMVKGLVHGILEGNRRLRDNQAENLAVVAKAFKWTEAEARDELAHVHLANLPENRAFFAGTIDSAGSFGGIFQSSVLAYGDVIRNPTDPARFMDTSALEALAKRGLFADQKIAIAPIRTASQTSLEGDPLLSKDIRFFFEPNSSNLDRNEPKNQEYLQTIKRFLQVSPGSTVVLRGHVDDARIGEFRKAGGEPLVQSMALKAMELSRQRAKAVSDALLAKFPEIDTTRIESVGRGWQEPSGSTDPALNRRVEVQWFTIE